MLKYSFDQAVFSYLVSTRPCSIFSKHIHIFNDSYVVSYTSGTSVLHEKNNEDEVIIIGFCVDAFGELEKDKIPQKLLSRFKADKDVQSVYYYCDRFAGKYVILFRHMRYVYVWGDATCSVQINYSFDCGTFCASSVDNLVALHMGYRLSDYSSKLRSGAPFDQALPNDTTMFDEVKALLPNHYLDVSKMASVRVMRNITDNERKTDEIVRKSSILIKNIVNEYRKSYTLLCPLTSGYDSRVVFSFLSEKDKNLQCYTFFHPKFLEKTGDVWVPREICKTFSLPHSLIPDVTAPQEYVKAIGTVIGSYHSINTINLAYTYLSSFRGKALVNGDIIDQIGKSLIGNSVPSFLATTQFLFCKMHNRNKLVKKEVATYLREIQSSGERSNIFDLFAIEQRCARWATQSSMIYSVCGISSLNIFNCQRIIELWMTVDRKQRKNAALHLRYLKERDIRLLDFPFNPGNSILLLKKTWPSFYLATFIKYYAGKLLHSS